MYPSIVSGIADIAIFFACAMVVWLEEAIVEGTRDPSREAGTRAEIGD